MPILELHREDHVGARPEPGGSRANARLHWHRREPELPQNCKEQRVLLEAVTAAPARDQLVGDLIELDTDAAPEQNVEVLERNGGTVSDVEAAQSLDVRRTRIGQTDAFQIVIEEHLRPPLL